MFRMTYLTNPLTAGPADAEFKNQTSQNQERYREYPRIGTEPALPHSSEYQESKSKRNQRHDAVTPLVIRIIGALEFHESSLS